MSGCSLRGDAEDAVIHFFGTIKMFEMLCFINYINILKTLKHIL